MNRVVVILAIVGLAACRTPVYEAAYYPSTRLAFYEDSTSTFQLALLKDGRFAYTVGIRPEKSIRWDSKDPKLEWQTFTGNYQLTTDTVYLHYKRDHIPSGLTSYLVRSGASYRQYNAEGKRSIYLQHFVRGLRGGGL